MIKTIGVVGAGTMGNGIAQVFAQAGYSVRLVDVARPMLDTARRNIEKSLGKFVEKGKLTAAARDAALGRLSTATSLDSLADADYIVEAIVEDVEAKRSLFTGLDALVKQSTVLASNTSSISITSLGAATKRPDRVLGMHFMNPVPLMPLVELIRGQATSAESMRVGIGSLCEPREDRGRSGGLSWIHRQSNPDADDQRGDLCGDGRRRDAGGDRHGHEARHEPSDGSADARRFHRPGRLPGDPQRFCTRAWAIRNTGRVRYFGAWSRPDTSGASRARAFTRTRHNRTTIGSMIASSQTNAHQIRAKR